MFSKAKAWLRRNVQLAFLSKPLAAQPELSKEVRSAFGLEAPGWQHFFTDEPVTIHPAVLNTVLARAGAAAGTKRSAARGMWRLR